MTPKQYSAKLRYLISNVLDLKTTDKKVIDISIIIVNEILEAHLFDLDEIEYFKQVKEIYIQND
jgi:hypothetical protein